MLRRNWILTVLGILLPTLCLVHAAEPGTKSFTITDRDVSSFVVTDRLFTPTTLPQENSKGKVAREDTIYLYSAQWCNVCHVAEAVIKKHKDLPFFIKVIDIDVSGKPKGFDSLHSDLRTIPHFEWDTDKGRVYSKWVSVEDLITKWNLSRLPAFPEKKGMQFSADNYNPRWTWPGNLAQHLKTRHGQDVDGLSQDQLESLHDRLHEGRK